MRFRTCVLVGVTASILVGVLVGLAGYQAAGWRDVTG